MRIALYNRWMRTMGGGERDMGAFAQVLQEHHDVDLLTHQPVDLDEFASRLQLAIPRVKLRLVPDDPEFASVIAASREYDLFINSSHLDMFIPEARRNVMRVFFPTRVPVEYAGDLPRSRAGLLGRLFGQPSHLKLISGFHPPELDADRPFAWTGPIARMLLLRRSQRPSSELQLVLHGWRPDGADSAQVQLFVDDRLLDTRELGRAGIWEDWRVPLPPDLIERDAVQIRLETTSFSPRDLGLNDDTRALGVALAAARLIGGPWSVQIAERSQAGIPDQSAYAVLLAHRTHNIAKAYDQILAISDFTRSWIERRWLVPSEIIFPPVDTSHALPMPKQPTILSVGRFFAGSHNKKHLPMIEAFKAMCDLGLTGWTYHLVGGCDESMPEHRAYLAQVRAAAQGYPIELHVNAPFSDLKRLYSTASIFWHATGYGEDENRDPDTFEHFGITTVEAMAAGCVPVVIAKAGQIETVEADTSGLLWHTLDELRAQTRRVIDDPALRERLSRGAIERSHMFELDAFARRVREVLVDQPQAHELTAG